MAKTKNPKTTKGPQKETKVATGFDRIISEGRERKKNEDLAQKIFSKDRRQSAPPKTKLGAGPSLASRVGVKKRASLGPSKPVPAGNIDGDWTHDLHGTVNGGGLASRISAPGGRGGSKIKQQQQRTSQLAHALERSAPQQQPAGGNGLSIRGLAGPYAVLAQNFAPGTTAADIESAMTPVGGEMVSCAVIKETPIMLVEMVFASKEGGEAVIARFNNQTADGRVIKVYSKPGVYKDSASKTPTGPRAQRSNEGNVIDGRNGFGDLMDTTGGIANGSLYSDQLVGGSRRGRFRGRAGR